MEERSKALNQSKEQFYNNLATVLQEIDFIDVKQMEERSKALNET